MKDIGNGEFDAYITKYDPFLLQKNSTIDESSAKNYFHINYIGKKSQNSVFAKLDPCYDINIVYTWFPETTCSSTNHHSYNDTSCKCGISDYSCTHGQAGYWNTTYSYVVHDCVAGNDGSGIGITTSPYPSGGNTTTSVSNPCSKVKNIWKKL